MNKPIPQAKPPRIGLFLCNCGTNISEKVDIDDILQWAQTRDDIAFVETHNLMCSGDGKAFVADKMAANKADHFVIAACSPKLHEKTFQDIAVAQGKNLTTTSMANIREGASWVTTERKAATEKARAIINAAIQRSVHHEPILPQFLDANPDVVVIGGGIAGVEAALLVAKSGRKVTIIEKEISLGGSMIKTEEVAPDMECAPCLLAPRLSEVRENENISVVTNAEVTDILGFLGNFTVRATQKARYVADSCIGCEACFEVCPVSTKSAFHLNMGDRKAVYTQFPGSVPATAAIDETVCRHFTDEKCELCVAECPFGSIDFTEKDQIVEVNAGAVILAHGFDDPDVFSNSKLHLPRLANVYTMPEFERLLSSNGPTMGKVTLQNGNEPRTVAILHCAGSLTENGLSYCSGVCCLNALKAGELLHHKIEGVKVINYHHRLIVDSIEREAFYQKQRHHGTEFQYVSHIDQVQYQTKGDQLVISAPGVPDRLVDMVVLSTGMAPSSLNARFAEMTDADLSELGFFKPDHATLNRAGTTISGIYAVGGAKGPCDYASAITQAHMAVGQALATVIPGKQIELETFTAAIDDELCAGCKLCVSVCPYKAIAFDKTDKISQVNEALCRGCGTCVATCPVGAAAAKHFTDQQLYAEIGGVLHV